jgi:hypothetical protein
MASWPSRILGRSKSRASLSEPPPPVPPLRTADDSDDMEPAAINVDHALKAFEAAKGEYERGENGPFELQGSYSLAEYERLLDVTETRWRLAYWLNDGTIFFYGDPSFPHEAMGSYLFADLNSELQDYLQEGPPSGDQEADSDIAKGKTAFLIFAAPSPKNRLDPDPDPFQHIRHPGKGYIRAKKDGPLMKEPDYYIALHDTSTLSQEPVPIVVFEGAYKNETIEELVFEILRWREAGAAISIGIKANVGSLPSLSSTFLSG